MPTIKFIKENPDIVKKDLKKRNDPEKVKWVDLILKKHNQYLDLLKKEQELRHRRNLVSDEIRQLKKQGQDIKEKIKEAQELPQKVNKLTADVEKLRNEINYYLMRIPNVLHNSVPVGKDETGNKTVRKHGEIKKLSFELKTHEAIIEKLKLGDFDNAAKVSGRGFYYLLGDLALMDLALQRFAIDALTKKGFTLAQVPLMLRRKPYEGVTELDNFKTMMYKIEDEDLYLIATSEHAIAARFSGNIFNEDELPKKFVGISPCFRKEIGSHGVDEKGLFRVHQFNKVEQFVFCRPEDSWKIFDELIKNAEEIYKKLKLPYRITNICTGDIGDIAAKKYDLEVYMPREKTYKEVVSCSNCTSYQAARLNIKYQKGARKSKIRENQRFSVSLRNSKNFKEISGTHSVGNEKEYVHTLNCTAIATSRTLRAILENYQQKDGTVKVPAALLPYMNGKKVLGK